MFDTMLLMIWPLTTEILSKRQHQITNNIVSNIIDDDKHTITHHKNFKFHDIKNISVLDNLWWIKWQKNVFCYYHYNQTLNQCLLVFCQSWNQRGCTRLTFFARLIVCSAVIKIKKAMASKGWTYKSSKFSQKDVL